MATATLKKTKPIEYPTSDGKPMAETDFHRIVMTASIQALEVWYAAAANIYVSGNLLMYYVRGNKRKIVSPDVFVVKGVAKKRRPYYLTWEEGKNPIAIIEITSRSTRKEDTDKKFVLYRDVLKVREYFLFDPFGDYLKPDRLRGYRLQKGEYVPIALVNGRMPSQVLGLHLEADGWNRRLFDPATGVWLATPDERAEREAERAEQAERDKAALLEENARLRQMIEFKKNGH